MQHKLGRRILPALAMTAAPLFALAQDTPPKSGQQQGQSPAQTNPSAQGAKPLGSQQSSLLQRAELGPKSVVGTEDGTALGTIVDHVVDRESGRVLGAVVEMQGGGKSVIVPLDRLNWNAENRQFRFRGQAQDIETMPEFSAEELQSIGHPGARPASAPKDPNAPVKPGQPAAGKDEKQEMHNVLSSKVMGNAVLATTDAYGTVSDVLINPKNGTIYGVLVKPQSGSGPATVVPWRELKYDEQGRLVIARSAADMTGAPTLDPNGLQDLKQEDIDKFQRFYATSPGKAPAKP